MNVRTAATLTIAFGLALTLAGCSGKSAPTPEASPSALATGAKIGAIEITIDPSMPADRRQVMEQYKAVAETEAELRRRLDTSMAVDGDLTLRVVLNNFRLRSNSANVWFGSMAGADHIGGLITLAQGDLVLKSFETGAGSTQGGIVFPGRTKRLRRLVSKFSERIVAGI